MEKKRVRRDELRMEGEKIRGKKKIYREEMWARRDYKQWKGW